MDSATAALDVANEHVWLASAEPPSATKEPAAAASTTPVANSACASDSYKYCKSKRLQKIVTHQGLPKKPVRVIYYHGSM